MRGLRRMGCGRTRPRRRNPGTRTRRRSTRSRRARCPLSRVALRVLRVVRNRRVVEVAIRDGNLLHRFGEEHVLGVDLGGRRIIKKKKIDSEGYYVTAIEIDVISTRV